jgi:protein-S-isoprenylcysteine O-methyltransferase Ste14
MTEITLASDTSAVRRLSRWRVPLGFVAGAAVLWLARPDAGSLALGAAIAVLGEAIRVWAAGHLEKSREVTRSGPYRYTRHPLYLGSTVMAVGIAVASRSAAVWVVATAYVVVMIGSAIRSEENFLRARFGATYDDYRAGRLAHEPRPFSLARAMRNREWRAVVGLVVAFAALAIKMRMS